MNPSDWFEQLDRSRQRQGNALDSVGLGPRESPSRVVFSAPGLALRCYGKGTANHPPLLIVPAPIKRWYVWDVAPERSVVRQALQRGLGVYVVEWTEPEKTGSPFGLADYAGPMLDACIAVITGMSACGQVMLSGHSLGGIFAALYSAYRPEYVAALALIDVPLNFDTWNGVFRRVAGAALVASVPSDRARRVPGSLLSLIFTNAAPVSFHASRYLDFFASAVSADHLATHMRVVRWTLDELPMSRRLFDDAIDLFIQNSFMRGGLAIGGVRLHPSDISAPLLNLYNPISTLVPPEAVLAFHRAAGSADKELVPYLGDVGVALQHIGPLVGDNAHQYVWPRVFDWLERIAGLPPAQPDKRTAPSVRPIRPGVYPGS